MNPFLPFVALTVALACSLAHGQSTTPVIYPAKGQSAQQLDLDRYQCHGWAREQSGFDPMQPAPQAAAAPATTTSGTTAAAPAGPLGGLGRSAALGAAVGEVAHNDAGRGAAISVLGGAAMQGMKQHQAAQAKQQQAAQQQAQQQAARSQQRSTFDRAFGACMEGRGYAVK